jgi:catechol 2,3-dioxygenase-like lactoylglutathione lyase family enzyme
MMNEIVAVVEIAISVNDLDAAEAFYRVGLGELKK